MANFVRGFEYFASASVTVRIEGAPILECAGLSYVVNESKRPLYGYSSRHFDAVARGQQLVQGELLINYVHQDYLFELIQMGLEDQGLVADTTTTQDTADPITDEQAMVALEALMAGEIDEQQYTDLMKSKIWSAHDDSPESRINPRYNPHDSQSGFSIEAIFGEQDLAFNRYGRTGCLLTSVHFLGRGIRIAVSEDVIVESYPFFARSIRSLKNTTSGLSGITDGEEFFETGNLT